MIFHVNRHPTDQQLRQFGIAMILGFGVLGGLIWLRTWWKGDDGLAFFAWHGLRGQYVAAGMWGLGLLLAVLSRSPRPLSVVAYVCWMTMAVTMGRIVTPVMMTLMYAIVLPVFSLLVRRTDPLRRKLGQTSYWEDYPAKEPTLERMERMF